jgi:cell wall-associated NlpC family hydrolase
VSMTPGKLAVVGLGALLAWSAIKGASVTGALRDIISGKQPKTGDVPIVASIPGQGSDGAGGPLPATNSAIANEALSIGPGHAYLYGGAPGKDGTRPWDCSSFVNFVIGARLGMPIPGYGAGKYTGSTHGPPTGAWLLWSGVVGIHKSQIQPGDLVVWQTHMGIIVAPNEYISAHSQAEGTTVSGIAGPGGEVAFYKRMKYAGSGPGRRPA